MKNLWNTIKKGCTTFRVVDDGSRKKRVSKLLGGECHQITYVTRYPFGFEHGALAVCWRGLLVVRARVKFFFIGGWWWRKCFRKEVFWWVFFPSLLFVFFFVFINSTPFFLVYFKQKKKKDWFTQCLLFLSLYSLGTFRPHHSSVEREWKRRAEILNRGERGELVSLAENFLPRLFGEIDWTITISERRRSLTFFFVDFHRRSLAEGNWYFSQVVRRPTHKISTLLQWTMSDCNR